MHFEILTIDKSQEVLEGLEDIVFELEAALLEVVPAGSLIVAKSDGRKGSK
jgi:hypothetical protein